MGIFNLLLPVLAAPEHGDIVHRTGPIERHERDDVAEIGRTHGGQRLAHPFRFQLEHAHRVAPLEQIINGAVIPAERIKLHRNAACRQQLHRLLQHRQGLEAQKVELHKAGPFDIFHVELGDRHVGSGITVERHQLLQRPVADHHACGMGGAMARKALQLHCIVDQPFDLAIIVIFRAKLRHAVERTFQRPGVCRMIGHQLGKPVDLTIAHLKNAPGILEDRAGLELSEGDDLRDMIDAIFLLDVADDFTAPRFAKINVEVGHRHTFGVQEAFEQQAKLQRIKIGDQQRPGNHRPCARTTSRPHRNVMILGPFDKVGNDQEIAGEAHLDDDVGFELQPVEIGLTCGIVDDAELRKPGVKASTGQIAQHPRLALDITGQARQDRLALGRGDGAALGDDQRVGQRFRQIVEQAAHFGGRFHPGVRRTGPPVGHVDIGAVGDAEHDVVRGMEMRFGKAGRVGCYQRQVAGIGEIQQVRLRLSLYGIEPTTDFDIETVGKECFQPLCIGKRGFGLILRKQAGQRAFAARGQRDQAVGPPLQHVQVDMRHFLQRPVEMRHGDQRAQIVIARLILRIERQPVMDRRRIGGTPRPQHAQHRADQRLDALALACVGKGHRAIKAVAIRDGGGGEAERPRLLGDLLGIDRPFQHGVGGEYAKRDESGVGHRALYPEGQLGDQPCGRKVCG